MTQLRRDKGKVSQREAELNGRAMELLLVTGSVTDPCHDFLKGNQPVETIHTEVDHGLKRAMGKMTDSYRFACDRHP